MRPLMPNQANHAFRVYQSRRAKCLFHVVLLMSRMIRESVLYTYYSAVLII